MLQFFSDTGCQRKRFDCRKTWQEEGLKEYYGRVVEKFGKEDFICLLGLLTRLEYVMKEEAHSQEAEHEH